MARLARQDMPAHILAAADRMVEAWTLGDWDHGNLERALAGLEGYQLDISVSTLGHTTWRARTAPAHFRDHLGKDALIALGNASAHEMALWTRRFPEGMRILREMPAGRRALR